MLVYRFIY